MLVEDLLIVLLLVILPLGTLFTLCPNAMSRCWGNFLFVLFGNRRETVNSRRRKSVGGKNKLLLSAAGGSGKQGRRNFSSGASGKQGRS